MIIHNRKYIILPPCICRAYCFHLKANFATKLTLTLADLFWKIARSNTPQAFEHHMNASHQINPPAAAYLRYIPALVLVASILS